MSRSVAGLPPIAALSTWEETACARSTAGEVYCWGDARFLIPGPKAAAQKRSIDNDCVLVPNKIAGLLDVTSISLSFSLACALTKSQQVWCWGRNFLMGLGLTTASDSCADGYGCSALPRRLW
jgi:alpha-tubulin suppressor-like RCC1 family protein